MENTENPRAAQQRKGMRHACLVWSASVPLRFCKSATIAGITALLLLPIISIVARALQSNGHRSGLSGSFFAVARSLSWRTITIIY